MEPHLRGGEFPTTQAASAFLASLALSSSSSSALPEHLNALCSILAHSGRVALLAELKRRGVSALGDRQKLANGLGRLLRDGPDALRCARARNFFVQNLVEISPASRF